MGIAACVCALIGLGLSSPSVRINEIYYDHPGADTGYEFIELASADGTPADLSGFTIEFHNGTGSGWTLVWRAPAGTQLAADAVFVVGGQNVVPAPDVVISLSLQNGPDALRLVDAAGNPLDLVGYGGLADTAYVETRAAPAVSAGQSLARVRDGVDTNHNALDFAAAIPTPGRRNAARHDIALSLDERTPSRAGRDQPGRERLHVQLLNLGLDDAGAGTVSVVAVDAHDHRELARVQNPASIGVAATHPLVLDVALTPGVHTLRLLAEYAPDERAGNDSLTVMRRVGRIPVVVSEVWSSPQAGCPQFVEVYNAGESDVDITDWSLRDTRARPVRLTEEVTRLGAGAVLVVTADPDALLACVPEAPVARVVGVEGTWPTFNRAGAAVADSVVVLDALGIPVNPVAYPGLPTSFAGRSLERVDLFPGSAAAVWRVADASVTCTPGVLSILALRGPPRAGVDASPNPFFPHQGDILRVAVTPGDGVARVQVRVFDASGRAEADLGTAAAFPALFVWDGAGARGGLASPGLYVVACELYGNDGTRAGVEKVVVGCAVRRL